MKPITPTLSPEQRRAQNCYQLAIVPASFLAMLGVIVVSLLLSIVLDLIGLTKGSSKSAVFIPIMFGGSLLVHLQAVHKVRLAGLSLESTKVEVIERAENNYQAEPRHWCPQTFSGFVGSLIIALLLSAAGWFLWHWPLPPVSFLQKALGMFSFGLFLFVGLAELIFGRAPRVYIDADGIVAFPRQVWRCRVRWVNICRCEISTSYDFMGQGPTRVFIFRSATGKPLMRLFPGSFVGLSHDEQAEIEREIRRRLTGTVETASE